MMALEPGETGPAWQAYGQQLRRQHDLRGVVIMSPHWMTARLAITSHPSPATWHDFGGFPEPLYALQYPAPGSPALAQTVQQALASHGLEAELDPERPFDHGAWMPLRFLLPDADVPVIQLSLPMTQGPAAIYALGHALQGLRRQGVLLVGSGSMTHNLQDFFGKRPERDSPAEPYVKRFSLWVETVLESGDRDLLIHYREQAPDAVNAHPTDEHFLPLFFALGAAGWGDPGGPSLDYFVREVSCRYLAMDSISFD